MLMAKFFPRSLKGDATQWFYFLLGESIDSFKILVHIFMGQYKHNIKEQGNISKLYVLCQGNNETIEKANPCGQIEEESYEDSFYYFSENRQGITYSVEYFLHTSTRRVRRQ